MNTCETCDAFYYELDTEDSAPRLTMKANSKAAAMFRVTTEKYVQACCEGVLEGTGYSLGDVDFFAFNCPTVWYHQACAMALGVDVSKTLNLCEKYANIGPVLPLVNLHHAASMGRIRSGDLVLVYTIGSSSNAGATLIRWENVEL